MRRFIALFLMLTLAFFMPTTIQVSFPEEQLIEFTDNTIEEIIREILEIPDRPITVTDMQEISRFEYAPADSEVNNLGESNPGDSKYTIGRSPQIESIDDLKYCTNLSALSLVGQPIESISALQNLSLLEEINLVQCDRITDLTPLSDKAKLSVVVLLGVSANDYTPIFELPELTVFAASGFSSAPDLSPLNKTQKLEKFFLRGITSSIDYSPLSKHTKMREVELHYTNSTIFSKLMDSWQNLEALTISASTITSSDLELLSNHRLTQIRFNDCPNIVDLNSLVSQQTLRSLSLAMCGISNVEPLSKIPSIERIELIEDNFIDLSSLRDLKNLNSLTISANGGLYSIEALQAMFPQAEINIR